MFWTYIEHKEGTMGKMPTRDVTFSPRIKPSPALFLSNAKIGMHWYFLNDTGYETDRHWKRIGSHGCTVYWWLPFSGRLQLTKSNILSLHQEWQTLSNLLHNEIIFSVERHIVASYCLQYTFYYGISGVLLLPYFYLVQIDKNAFSAAWGVRRC